jgi:hypothetical protein
VIVRPPVGSNVREAVVNDDVLEEQAAGLGAGYAATTSAGW